MIRHTQGNLLEADVDALVNTVNCVGFMGKGIALQFKRFSPENFAAYARACAADEVLPGRMLVFKTDKIVGPDYIINFPTKRHWRGGSRMEDIQSGLHALIEEVRARGIKSIAVPPLGCGNGGLDWDRVRPLIEEAFSELPDVEVLLFEPAGAPDAMAMPVNTARPKMTPGRAVLIKLMETYASLDYRRTLLEVHKLAYFMQEAGEPLKLKFVPGHYGPYASNLSNALEMMEGHFIRGCGDSERPDVEIDLLPLAVQEADAYLVDRRESVQRLGQVAEMIKGYETPYGMELLSTVHWVAVHAETTAKTDTAAVAAVFAWNERKRKAFRESHIRKAFAHLVSLGWIGSQ